MEHYNSKLTQVWHSLREILIYANSIAEVICTKLDRFGNLDLRNLLVKDNVVVLQEDITQNSKIKASVTEACITSGTILFKDEGINRNLELSTIDGEVKRLEVGGVTADSVSTITIVSGTVLSSNLGGNGFGEEQESVPALRLPTVIPQKP
ncbi:hypothetical protein G6F42_022919 [Rhizopus arrhizus]|nr:hypothetical protein G6F42_022919 [Rhizopus arrhizus]